MKTVAVNQILKALSSEAGLLYAENRGKRAVGKIITFVGHDGAAGKYLVGKLFGKEDAVVALPSRKPVIKLQQPNSWRPVIPTQHLSSVACCRNRSSPMIVIV